MDSERIHEILWVQMLQWSNAFVGIDTLKKTERIIAENPKEFPWEHKYNSIPQEVHEAYNKEQHPERTKENMEKLWNTPIESKGGIMAHIKENPPKEYTTPSEPITAKLLNQWWQEMMEADEKRRKDKQEYRKKFTSIWNKHYGPYNLKCREFEGIRAYEFY